MTDWTTPEDVPEVVRERLHDWLNAGHPAHTTTLANYAVAEVIRAFWPVPARTLAEELRDLFAPYATAEQEHIISRAEQIEQERDQSRAEVGRLNAERTSKESLQVDQPDPADVPYGEAWLVEWKGRRHTAVRVPEQYWWVWRSDRGYATTAWCSDITLITRLVPAPCVITNHDELDRLAEGTIVRDKDGDAWRRTCDEWTTTADYGRFTSWAVSRSGPVTVLWEPEA